MNAVERSPLGRMYDNVYASISGSHPRQRLWHYQWLSASALRADLARLMPRIGGRVLDVGCENKPYEAFATQATEYLGLDVVAGPKVDLLVSPDEPWPVRDEMFDAVICTEVLEHVTNVTAILTEIRRVLRPGGIALITVPFIYEEHGSHDYRRFTAAGLRNLLESSGFKVILVNRQGGAGGAIGQLLLNWLSSQLDRYRATRFLRAGLLPFWLLTAAVVNGLGAMVDRLDRSERLYLHTLLVCEKPIQLSK